MTTQQIEFIKSNAAKMSEENKVKYLRGVRDGLDLAVLIAKENRFLLAENATLLGFLDYLDQED